MAGEVVTINDVAPADDSAEKDLNSRVLVDMGVVESWAERLVDTSGTKFRQVWVCIGVKTALHAIGEYGYGARTLWKCEASQMAKILARAIGEKLEVPVQVEVRKLQADVINIHVSIGK